MKSLFLKFIFLLTTIIFFIFSEVTKTDASIDCDNRFLTLVNPVRGRNLWVDKSISPLKNQYEIVSKFNFPVTWLLQYDALVDKEIIKEVNKFNSSEIGVFLEVSQNYAQQARVIYPHAVSWYNPQAIFLSGYSQSDRRKLIDKLFQEFKQKFAFYPKSVGAWWIDAYSLNYMKDKYDIKSVMIVADQKTTDNYGVWGQWWGVPYYPAKTNILIPANNLSNKLDVVIIQWAQRDMNLAYGEGWIYSNYSLQANDYIRQGKDTKYFASLVNTYLDCRNPVGQITVGLETGIESVGYINEYENQLQYLKGIPGIKFTTMSQFADSYYRIFPKLQGQFTIGSDWILNTDSRSNSKLGDYTKYDQDISFKDFFLADHEVFLDRNLQKLNRSKQYYFPYFILVILAAGIFFAFRKSFNIWLIGTFFAIFSYGLILRSFYGLGWQVFYGPAVPFLIIAQITVSAFSYLIVWLICQIKLKNMRMITWFIPLSFGIDFVVQSVRISYFGEKYYFLFAVDSLKHIGVAFSKPFNLVLINQDFPSVIASSLLRFNFSSIWDSLYLSLIGYPLLHLLLAAFLGYLYTNLPGKARKILMMILIILAVSQLIIIFQADPRLVQ